MTLKGGRKQVQTCEVVFFRVAANVKDGVIGFVARGPLKYDDKPSEKRRRGAREFKGRETYELQQRSRRPKSLFSVAG